MSQLVDKYIVTKREGPTDPHARYFVLRLDTDPAARAAARWYAVFIQSYDPELADQLRQTIDVLERGAQEREATDLSTGQEG